MAFRLISVFITVLICWNFEEVKSLDCAGWCPKDCSEQGHLKGTCLDAKSKCDCTAASYEQLKELINDYKDASHKQQVELNKDSFKDFYNDLMGLVLGVTFFMVIVGIIGCWFIYGQLKQLNTGAGGPGRAMYQPSPSRMNYGYQPGGARPRPLTYTNPNPSGISQQPQLSQITV